MTTYDVIIAGASFAGLAAARRLRARVALLDRVPLGAGVTSACAAPVGVVEEMGAAGSILQVHDRLVLHTPHRSAVWPLPEPFCTFDYERFCRLAAAGAGAEFRQTAVLGRRGGIVETTGGELAAGRLIDATGWRRALVSARRARSRPPRVSPLHAPVGRSGGGAAPREGSPHLLGRLIGGATAGSATVTWREGSSHLPGRLTAFGIESEVPARVEPGLHFYFLPEVRDGYAWAFPAGGAVRFGVLSYLGRTKLHAGLVRFMARFGLRPGSIHGGYLAGGLRDPVEDGVFVAGDAAGQCLPLTGEGIRTAILAGSRAGGLVQDILDGRRSPAEAAARYRRFVAAHRRAYRALLWGNLALLAMPLPVAGAAAAYLSRPGPLAAFMRRYLGIFAAPPPAAGDRPGAR